MPVVPVPVPVPVPVAAGAAVTGVVAVPGVVVVVGDVSPAHVGVVNVSLMSVTAPLRASRRPWIVAPLFALIDVSARMLPTKVAVVSRVAELPTCQNTLQGEAPLISDTTLLEPIVSDESVWKMKTESGSFSPSRVKVPVSPRAPLLAAE